MLLQEHKDLAKKVVAMGKEKGCDTVEVSINYQTENEIAVREQRIETLQQANTKALAITVSRNKQRASFSSNDFSQKAISDLMDEAVRLTKYTGSDDFFSLPDESELGIAEGNLELFDPEENKIKAEQRIQMAMEMEKKMLAAEAELISDGTGVSSYTGHSVFANSLGFCEGYPFTFSSIYASCAVPDRVEGLNSARKQSDGWYDANRFFARLDSIDTIAKTAAERALRKRGARKPASEKLPVIFDFSSATRFISYIAQAITGYNLYNKQSFLLDKLGTQIAADLITIEENPLIPGQNGSRPFDHEGVRARRKTIVEKGVLKSYLLDTYSAKKLGMKTTGNSGGTANLYLLAGSHSFDDLLKATEKGILVTSLSGFGANIQNGDFSQGAQGFMIENGKISYPVNEFTIASTFMTILEQIDMIANDMRPMGSIYSPSFRVKEMMISGT